MCWKPRWSWFVFFWTNMEKGPKFVKIYIFQHFQFMWWLDYWLWPIKDIIGAWWAIKDYITLLSTNWVQKYVLQLLMDKILWEARKVTWWKRSVIDDRIFLRQNTSIFVLASVAFVAIIDGLRFQVDPWVWHLVWWLVSSLFIIFTSQKDEVEPHLKNTAQFVALTVIIIRNNFKRDGQERFWIKIFTNQDHMV